MANTAQVETKVKVTLAPYMFLYGRCEEALKFYAGIFGGTYELTRVGDYPEMKDSPAESRNDVMHASFTAPGLSFFAADGREKKSINPDDGNISLALNAADRVQGERLFKALAEGGKIEMPFSDAFWGGQFGIVDDRFGNQWFVTSP